MEELVAANDTPPIEVLVVAVPPDPAGVARMLATLTFAVAVAPVVVSLEWSNYCYSLPVAEIGRDAKL